MTTTMTPDQMRARIAELEAQAASPTRALSIKIGTSGTVCIYGLQARFPVSLYPGQWEKLIALAPQIQEVIRANKPELDRLGAASKAAKQAAKLVAAPVLSNPAFIRRAQG